ncbi:uncharacterized protein LOC111602333 isoform X2 [Drosophila hydei]|uniref:Uncharacterized protein LOC111602333 isoform X2 n=1 Tax=Drosophila hydei TaxID=7224 RepID=A0A6J1M543_DROHY|nr:uncharacterized protein LOC111602333 isoform X2 [Drosophila hydei]
MNIGTLQIWLIVALLSLLYPTNGTPCLGTACPDFDIGKAVQRALSQTAKAFGDATGTVHDTVTHIRDSVYSGILSIPRLFGFVPNGIENKIFIKSSYMNTEFGNA